MAWSRSSDGVTVCRHRPRRALAGLIAVLLLFALGLSDCRATGDEPARLDLSGDPLPDGAVARLGSLRFRQPDGIVDVAFGPGGQLATLDSKGVFRIWETSSGRVARTFPAAERRQFASAAAWSHDGLVLASAGRIQVADDQPHVGSIRLWNAESGEVLRTIAWAGGEVNCVAFSSDGQTVVSSGGGTLRFHDVQSGDELLTYKLTDDTVQSVAVSSRANVLAAATQQGALWTWDWLAGAEPSRIDQAARTTCVAFSPDGAVLAYAERGRVQLWDAAGGMLLREMQRSDEADYIPRVAFSPDGRKLAATSYNHAVILWDPATGKQLQRLDAGAGMRPNCLAISADSRMIAAADSHVLLVWNIESGEKLAAGSGASEAAMRHIVFLPGDDLVATAADDQTVRIWKTATGGQRLSIEHGHWVRGFAMSGDGRWMASSSLDDSVRLSEADTGKEVYRLPGHGRLGGSREVVFTPDGHRFASWGDDLYLRVWDVATGKALIEHAIRPSGLEVAVDEEGDVDRNDLWRFGLGQAAFTPDGTRFLLMVGKQVHVFDVQTGEEKATLPHEDGHLIALAVSPDGTKFLTSSWGKSVGIPLPDGRTRYTSARNHAVRLRDLDSGEELFRLVLPEGGAGPVAFSADGRMIAAAADLPQPEVRLIDAETGAELGRVSHGGGRVASLAFSSNGSLLATGFADTTALIWDLARFVEKRSAEASEGREGQKH